MTDFTIETSKRDKSIKNVFRKSLRENFIPGIFYNRKMNHPIRFARDEFIKQFSKAQTNTIFKLKLEGKEYRAFIKDYSRSLRRNRDIEHVDFYAIEEDTMVKIDVPIQLTGVAKGIIQGAHLEHYTKQIKLHCKVDDIPPSISIDITDMDIGDHVYARDIKLAKGIELLESPDRAIVAVLMSSKGASEAQEETEASESDASSEVEKPEEEKVKKNQ